jgi:hypothetical protein
MLLKGRMVPYTTWKMGGRQYGMGGRKEGREGGRKRGREGGREGERIDTREGSGYIPRARPPARPSDQAAHGQRPKHPGEAPEFASHPPQKGRGGEGRAGGRAQGGERSGGFKERVLELGGGRGREGGREGGRGGTTEAAFHHFIDRRHDQSTKEA